MEYRQGFIGGIADKWMKRAYRRLLMSLPLSLEAVQNVAICYEPTFD